MFHKRNHIVYSDHLLQSGVSHGFATRTGGVSVIPEVASMSLAPLLGDSPDNVSRNIGLLASYAGLESYPVIYGSQVHSAEVLTVTAEDVKIPHEERQLDGYVTDVPGIALMVKSADCLPILFSGSKVDGSPVIGATHAGWKGTVCGIAAVAVEKMVILGAIRDTIRVAIGPSIHECCFEVKEDFIESVISYTDDGFARRHIREKDGSYFASLQDMNIEILGSAGISREMIDVSADCTAHMPHVYHSHRATGGKRGVGGGIIGIIK